jgi:acyl carrier protein
MKTREEIFIRIQKLLVEIFELEEESICLESHIYEDLDFDSLDAIELSVRLGTETGISLQEEELRAIRTIADAVDIIYQRINL